MGGGCFANSPEDKNKSQNSDMLDKFQSAIIVPQVNLIGYSMLENWSENNQI